MATFPEILAARNAEKQASKEMSELLDADFALLHATDRALCTMRRMYCANTMREAVQDLNILEHRDELHCLMAKYGFELVPSEKYVDGWDIRVIGTTEPATMPAMSAHFHKRDHNHMVDIGQVMRDADKLRDAACNMPIPQAVSQHSEEQRLRNPTPQFKPGCY